MSAKLSPLPPSMALLPGSLYCDDETFDENDPNLDESRHPDLESSDLGAPHLLSSDLDLTWVEEDIEAFLDKERREGCVDAGMGFVEMRKEAVEWMIRVGERFGFSEVSVVLGVCYLDRFLSGVEEQKGKEWMGQLASVACLSLAAKMEEISVPLLVDLQVEGAKYVFEAKTIQRMEIIVLSALKWKMNPVTPFSFLDYLIRRFGWKKMHCRFLKMCGSLVVAAIADSRSLCYSPSMLAAATMLYVIQEFEPTEFFGYQEQLVDVLKLSKEKLVECYSLVSDLSKDSKQKSHHPEPSSPHGIIDMSFSCENSNDSWVASSTVSSPVEPPSKRRRTQEQKMRLRRPFIWPGSA